MGNHSTKDKEGPEPKLSAEELDKLIRKRNAIVQETVHTERSYVKSLQLLQVAWKQPLVDALVAEKPIISVDDVDGIFSTLDTIVDLHVKLLRQMEERLANWNNKQKIGDIFVANAESLKTYTDYINNYNHALHVIGKISTVKAWQKFRETNMENPEIMDIQNLLIMPVQRLPRYCLLLTELVNSTRRKHKDYKNLRAALNAIIEATNYINEKKRLYEMSEDILVIQTKIKNKFELLADHRTIVKEGTFELAKPSSKGSAGKVTFWLFNDALLIARPITGIRATLTRENKFDVEMWEAIRDIDFLDNPDAGIISMDIRGPTESFVVLFQDSAEKKALLAEFYEVRSKSHKLPALVKRRGSTVSENRNVRSPTRETLEFIQQSNNASGTVNSSAPAAKGTATTQSNGTKGQVNNNHNNKENKAKAPQKDENEKEKVKQKEKPKDKSKHEDESILERLHLIKKKKKKGTCCL